MEQIVIVSRIEANIYKFTKDGTLKLVKSFLHPEGRLRNKELQSDHPGLSRGKFKGSAPHSLTAERNPHDDIARQFIKKLVSHLKSQWDKNHKLNFKIVAEAKLLGMIRTEISKSKILNSTEWLEKDLQNVPPSKWPKILGLKKIPKNVDIHPISGKGA